MKTLSYEVVDVFTDRPFTGYPLPSYSVLEISGEPHEQRFRVRCDVDGLGIAAEADGSSRRRAEQDAAQRILDDPSLRDPR